MNELIGTSNTITSLEVSDMVGKQHNELLKDIRRYIKQLNEGKIPHVEFFKESSYVDEKGQARPCFDVSRKGCEYIANKLTGVKGAVFTAKFINRFHDMEDYINQGNSKTSIEQGVSIVKFIADDLNVNTASRLLMYEKYCKDVGVPTGFLPKYEHNDSRQLKALTTLLKENGCGMSAVKFNQKLIECGYIEERERPSSIGNGTKKFKALTESGLKYGENAVSPHNQKEVQPLYYSDIFLELYEEVTK